MKKLITVLAITLFTGASSALWAQLANLPVTTTVHDNSPTSVPYRIQSDGAPYVSLKQGKNVVESQVWENGNWEFSTRASTTRKVFLDFRDSAGGSGAPFQTALLPVRFLSQCTELYNVNLQLLGLGETVECGLNFGFAYGGKEYGVRMRPHLFAGTTTVAWTCTSVNAQGRCSAWEAAPHTVQSDGSYKAVAQLFRKASKPNQSDVVLGNFYFTFRITFTAS